METLFLGVVMRTAYGSTRRETSKVGYAVIVYSIKCVQFNELLCSCIVVASLAILMMIDIDDPSHLIYEFILDHENDS